MSAPRLMIHELPQHPDEWRDVRVLRHWLTLADGRIFSQDEILRWESGQWTSERREWVQLPTPPTRMLVVGLIDHGGLPLAMREDGQSFIHDGKAGVWVPYLAPVPGSIEWAETQEGL